MIAVFTGRASLGLELWAQNHWAGLEERFPEPGSQRGPEPTSVPLERHEKGPKKKKCLCSLFRPWNTPRHIDKELYSSEAHRSIIHLLGGSCQRWYPQNTEHSVRTGADFLHFWTIFRLTLSKWSIQSTLQPADNEAKQRLAVSLGFKVGFYL